MGKLRLGVVGCGYWGPNLIRNFNEIPSSEVVAVADLREDRLNYIQNGNHGVITTKDYRDLFEMNLDAMVIATPPSTHYALAHDSLEHNLNVLVEKPLTTCSQDAEDLVELADKKHLVLMVGHTFTFNSAVYVLKNLIDSGELGKIYYIDAARLSLGLFQRDMNALWDLAPHDLSILIYLLSMNPISIDVCGMDCVFPGIYDVVYMNLVFPNHVLAHVHISWLDPCKVRRVTVVGSKKMVVYNDVQAAEKIKIYDKGVDTPQYTNTFGDFQCSYRYGDVLIPNIKLVEPLRLECQHFLDCIDNHCKSSSSGEEGLRIVRILEAAQAALDHHQSERIEW